MEEIKLSDDVIEQGLTKEEELFIDKFILNEELENRYGLCKECRQPNTGKGYYCYYWCQSCNAKHFQQNFKNWSSGNNDIDEFIQNVQLKAKNYKEVLEWIDYDRFEHVEYLAKGDFGTVCKAIWKDGYIYSWNSENHQWDRYKEYYKKGYPVILKCLHSSQGITDEFLKKIDSHLVMSGTSCYGITKHPESNNFMMAFNIEIKFSDDVIEQIKDFDHKRLSEDQGLLIDKLILNEELKKRYIKYGLCKECRQPNTGRGFLSGEYWCQPCNAKHFQQNFNNWNSGNHEIDKFIQDTQLKAKVRGEALEWINYSRFKHVKYLAKGGFGTVYKATWKDKPISMWDSENFQWKRGLYAPAFEVSDEDDEDDEDGEDNCKVVLKSLHNSQNITVEFLSEIAIHNKMGDLENSLVIPCYGITKDPKTNDFMMVMQYAKDGSLRQHLNNNFNSLDWKYKLTILYTVAKGLKNIHKNGLIHRDFHCGNILSIKETSLITDLGLCQPANIKTSQSSDKDKKIYGVLPYVAPEVLRGKEYTQASDIYGFGIIAYEVCTGLPPYHDIAHDEFLTIGICKGLRPKSNYKVPQLILDMIKKCWNADPLQRPKAEELFYLLEKLYDIPEEMPYSVSDNDYNCDENLSTIKNQCEEADNINRQLSSAEPSSSSIGLSYKTHPQAVYRSKLLDFKNLPEPKNAESEYSECSMAIDFIQLGINSKDEGN